MFALYCDDSGTHGGSECAVAACYIAPTDQWESFVTDWKRAEEQEKFGAFRMADFVAKKKQFSTPEWADPIKRKRVMERLTTIIKARAHLAFFSVVEKRGYDLEMPKEFIEKLRLGSHYTFAVRICLGRLLRWRLQRNHKWPIQFVFDQMSKGKGEIDRVFEHHLAGGEAVAMDVDITPSGWSFQDHRVVLPLQAADILAWETLWHLKNIVLSKVDRKPRRKSYSALLSKPIHEGYHDQVSVRQLVQHWKENKMLERLPFALS